MKKETEAKKTRTTRTRRKESFFFSLVVIFAVVIALLFRKSTKFSKMEFNWDQRRDKSNRTNALVENNAHLVVA